MIAASGVYQEKLAFIKPAHPLHNYLHFISLRSKGKWQVQITDASSVI